MKRFCKLLVNLIAVIMLAVTCITLTACEEIKVLNVTFSIYNVENDTFEETTIEVDLYRHLAPKTVDAVIDAAEKGYYDNTAIYKFKDKYSNQFMVGDYKYVYNAEESKGEIVQNEIIAPQVYGEFEKNGVIGSNLVSKKGSIGLWRTWCAQDTENQTNSPSADTGRAVWYIPSGGEIGGYAGNYCVFAQVDLENEDVKDVFANLSNLFNKDINYAEYTIYYTGEYNDDDFVKNNGLTFHAERNFNEEDEDETIFEAEKGQYVCYNEHMIRVPIVDKNTTKETVGAKIVKVTVA